MKRTILMVMTLVSIGIALEAVLRLGGWMIVRVQDYRNQRALAQKSDYRILALGESTTASGGEDSWPSQLERLLSQRFPGKHFSVINKGRNSTNSWAIVSELEHNLDIYKPDIVITMMGVNDEYGASAFSSEFIPSQENARGECCALSSLRVYKLVKLAQVKLAQWMEKTTPRVAGIDSSASPIDDGSLTKEGISYFLTERMEEAEQSFTKALEQNQKDIEALVNLGSMYLRTNRDSEAQQVFLQAIKHDPHNELGYVYLGDMYAHYFQQDGYPFQDFTKAEEMYNRAMQANPSSVFAHRKLAKFYRQMTKYGEAEDVYKKILSLEPETFSLFMDLGDLYSVMGKPDAARDAYWQAAQKKPALATHYDILYRTVNSRGIPLVAVQYPLRSLEPLRVMLSGNRGQDVLGATTQDDIFFVDNEKSFKDAVQNGKYEDYFIDRFAGDFGHATAKGNELLARNIADALEQAVLQKP